MAIEAKGHPADWPSNVAMSQTHFDPFGFFLFIFFFSSRALARKILVHGCHYASTSLSLLSWTEDFRSENFKFWSYETIGVGVFFLSCNLFADAQAENQGLIRMHVKHEGSCPNFIDLYED